MPAGSAEGVMATGCGLSKTGCPQVLNFRQKQELQPSLKLATGDYAVPALLSIPLHNNSVSTQIMWASWEESKILQDYSSCRHRTDPCLETHAA